MTLNTNLPMPTGDEPGGIQFGKPSKFSSGKTGTLVTTAPTRFLKRYVREMMTPNIKVIPPDCTIQDAAKMMKALGIGSLPVCDGVRVLGMVTDRDITVHVVGEERSPVITRAREVMSAPVIFCFEDQEIEDAARVMEVMQVRRLVVLNKSKRLVGILSIGDIAVKTGREELAGEILEYVSQPDRKSVAS